jgi:hypothetical protein
MSARADEALPLLCDLGWHRPDGLARWNDGYYFSKCSRCKRDLVRTAFGSWQVPKGFRVVWQQKPPETREEITLVPKELESVGAAAPVGVVDAPPRPARRKKSEPRRVPNRRYRLLLMKSRPPRRRRSRLCFRSRTSRLPDLRRTRL